MVPQRTPRTYAGITGSVWFMSLAVALPCAALSAVFYGASTAVQHTRANAGAERGDAADLVRLLRDPRWLLSVGGDVVGLVLQVVALSTGPVVLVQPLLVLAVPVALPVGRLLGGKRPRPSDYLACAAIIAGLSLFFGVVGNPGLAKPLTAEMAAASVVLALLLGSALCGAVRGRSPSTRAAVYGAVAGGWFGLVGVLLDAASAAWRAAGWQGPGAISGWAPLAGVAVVGAAALVLTQVSFQVGPLSASFPANEVAAPMVSVTLGATVLHEHMPTSPAATTSYLVALAALVAGTVWLARA